VSGALSGIFVVLVNAWMNAPVGFTLAPDGTFATVDPLRGLRSPMAVSQTLHMTLAAYAATGLAVAGVHAGLLLRPATRRDAVARAFHRRALSIALGVGAPAAVLQPLSGHYSAERVAATQPVKLAAMEGQWRTERGAPLRIGGWPDEEAGVTRWSLEVPGALSLLAFGDARAEVQGLDAVPRADRPPVLVTHLAFQLMVACGTAMAAVALWALVAMGRVVRARHAGPHGAHAGAAPVAAARPGRHRAARLRRHRGRVDGHRGGAPAVGGAGGAAHRRRGDADAGARRAVRDLHPALRLPRGGGERAALAAHRRHARGRRAGRADARARRRAAAAAAAGGAAAGRVARRPARRRARGDTTVSALATVVVGGVPLGLPELAAGAMALALTGYVLTGGADFGGGVWDLLARGPRREAQRALVADAIGPIWEANHVWLILVVVLCFTCFPPAFATLSTVLHVPLTLVLVGVVLRGSAFVFRAYDATYDATYDAAHDRRGAAGDVPLPPGVVERRAAGGRRDAVQRRWGLVFSVSSLVTPVLLGVCLGALASGAVGRVDVLRGGFAERFVAPWATPFAWAVGALALTLFAFLAATYLTVEAAARGEAALADDFRAASLAAQAATLASAAAAWVLAPSAGPVRAVVTGGAWAVVLQGATAACALAAVGALVARRWRLARLAAQAQAACLLWGWAWAQFPELVPPGGTARALAAPDVTLALSLACSPRGRRCCCRRSSTCSASSRGRAPPGEGGAPRAPTRPSRARHAVGEPGGRRGAHEEGIAGDEAGERGAGHGCGALLPGRRGARGRRRGRVEGEGELQPPERLAPAAAGQLDLAAHHHAHDLAPERHARAKRARTSAGAPPTSSPPSAPPSRCQARSARPAAIASSSTAARAATAAWRSATPSEASHASPSSPPAAS
jgi:cytochrome bd-type quinol oxidase subunit 2